MANQVTTQQVCQIIVDFINDFPDDTPDFLEQAMTHLGRQIGILFVQNISDMTKLTKYYCMGFVM